MATATATMTDQAVPPPPVLAPSWAWAATRLEEFQRARDTLLTIKVTYSGWDDHLSKRLHRWCEKVFSTSIGDRASALAHGEKVLNRLSTKILVNPFDDRYPLLSPVLDRNWTWEEWTLCDYMDRTKRKDSPYDGQAIDAKPHLFARAMIAWLRTLRSHEPIKSSWDYVMPRLPDGPKMADAYFKLYQLFAKRVISMQKTREMRFQAEAAEKDFDTKAAESEKNTKEETKENAARLQKLRTIFQEGMAANKKAHKEETERLKEKQRTLQEKQDKLDKEKEKMKEQIAKQEQEILRLFWENERRRQEIAALYAASDRSSCVIL